MQIFELAPLKQRALLALTQSADRSMSTAALAAALKVPAWVADSALTAMQEAGDVLPTADGWRLSCSATVALALTMPAALCRARGA